MAFTESQWAAVATLLGREPRGLEDIPVLDDGGQPRVIRVASLVDGKPFPTLFWLVDPVLNYRIDQDEARGLIKDFQTRVNAEPGLRASIGGIADFSRIRCLHTWYAAHLVVPNTIGGLLDRHWTAP